MFQNGLTENIISALTRNDAVTLPLLTGAITLLAKMLRSNEAVPASIGDQSDIFGLLANCFDMVNADDLAEGAFLTTSLLSVFDALLSCDENQTRVAQVPAIIRAFLTLAMASQHRSLQLSAITTIDSLARDNRMCCAALIEHGAAKTLQTVLYQTKSAIDVKAATLRALWTISGGELGEQKAIASLIGEDLLISILQDTPLNSSNDTHTLHHVACEALGVLCRGPRSRQKEVLAAGAPKVYLAILRSKNPRVVIEVLRSMSLLCVGTGLMPDSNAQKILAQAAVGSSTTLRLLLNVLIHSNSEVVSVAAAYTLATMVLGNARLLAELESDPDWTFLHIVKLFYSNESSVRLHAAAALAVFCFNSQRNVDIIKDEIGKLTRSAMGELINSKHPAYRYDAAFDQIVLSQLVENSDPAFLSADGMKVLLNAVKLLKEAKDSYDIELVAAATGHIASLLRLKSSGVARGFITIGIVEALCNVIESPLMSETGRDAAANALATLTNLPDACRLILKELRLRPFIGFIMAAYTPLDRASYEFRTRWKSMQGMHLPTITDTQKDMMKLIKTHDRRKALVETNITWNRVSCFFIAGRFAKTKYQRHLWQVSPIICARHQVAVAVSVHHEQAVLAQKTGVRRKLVVIGALFSG